MSVKLIVTLRGEPAGVSRNYALEIDAAAGHSVAVVGPADARTLIAQGRALFDQMERHLDAAGAIDEAVLAMVAAPHPAGEAALPGGDAPPGGAPAQCPGEGQLTDESDELGR